MKQKLTFNFNLKDKSEELTLLYIIGYSDKRFKVSTKQKVYSKAWSVKTQRCIISSDFPEKVNRLSESVNSFLNRLESDIETEINPYSTADNAKEKIQRLIDELMHKAEAEETLTQIKPLDFFDHYVSTMHQRVDPHTKRFLSERTIAHHKTVLRRIVAFFDFYDIRNDFSVFDSEFETKFSYWAYKAKGYHANTIPATMSVLKVWLNAAVEDGIPVNLAYKRYTSKGSDVDNIYLTEEEIERIYSLDIPDLKAKGLIDKKSEIEGTRDLFIIGCWTGLRQSDINHIDKALFDLDDETITVITEKTTEKVVIPMHRFIKAIYLKYDGHLPKMCHKANFNKHLVELGRLAEINEEVLIKENVAGKIVTNKYKKYQLIKSHTARRSFATNMFLKGAPTINIMKLTGHTTEANFMKYIKVSRAENAKIMKKYF